jgi:hypothetical protein
MALAALMNACHGAEAGATTRAAVHTAGATAAAIAAIANTNSSSSSSSTKSGVASQDLPALVRSRHAGVLARLSSHLPALQLLCSSESVAVLAAALVRSATLGGDLSSNTTATTAASTSAAKMSDSALTAARDERDQLVRVTAAVARATSATGASPGVGESLVHSGAVRALLSFLPPARSDAISGCATRDTVALAPLWRAPPALAGNVCGALLHLLSDSPAGADVAAVVAQSGGIERLLCLFANSADGPVRKNAAICVARLAKVPELKLRIEALRGMEMLVQAGRTLV